MTTQADRAPALRMPPAEVESLATGGVETESYIPPKRFRHKLTIKVYDWCPEHGAHTDEGLEALGHYAPGNA